ncbi:ragulator complex protein LAMTOR5 homolog [Pecten maximus]|uniref:ragulator complex protein LAMTOR5 homolog n=1 Tax=Pecten maximus TaxID=6579 RepID=UPI001458ECBD|nr:ragulator complex protein LAMTOR5 homolog [Pecten maximus]
MKRSESPGVAGVLCADEHGLCLSSKGIAKMEAAGQLASLARQAQQLHPLNPGPVIAIEAEGGTVLIKNESDVTMAVYKSPMS